MQQLVQSAQTLQIYQHLTQQLHNVLNQLLIDKNQMESKIIELQKLLVMKDQIIQNLQSKLYHLQYNQSSNKPNLLQPFPDIHSQPLLQCKKQTSTTTQSSSPKHCTININTYFQSLISQINTNSIQTHFRAIQTPLQKTQNFIKHSQFQLQPDEIKSFNFLTSHKSNFAKDSNIQTRAQTSQSNFKDTQVNTSNKENLRLIHPNVSSNFFLFEELQLDFENIGKKKDQAKAFNKQKPQRLGQNILNMSNLFMKNIKTRRTTYCQSKQQLNN